MTTQNLEHTETPASIGANLTVAIYSTHEEATTAVKELEKSGFDMKKLSIVGKDYHTEEHVTGYYTTGDRMKAWGKFGAFWGGLWGLLFGSAFFFIPSIGPILMAGPLVGELVSVVEGAVVAGGLSVLAASLVGIGIPKNSALAYEMQIGAGKFVLIAHGTQVEINQAKGILARTDHQGLTEHAA